MNPQKLFALTAKEQAVYQIQPDEFPGYDWAAYTEEYEVPPLIAQTSMRFWYNTQKGAFTSHWHDAQEIIVPLEETYTVTVQDKTFRLEPGDILLIPPGSIHSIEASDRGSRFIFLLELNPFCRLTDFSRTQALLSKPVCITADTYPEIYEQEIKLIMQAARYYWGNKASRQLWVCSCLMAFYAHYTDFCIHAARPDSASESRSPDNCSQKISALLGYLQRHYADSISLEDAAIKTGLSKFYFSRVFKQHTGQTFYDYLCFLRVRAAVDMLKNTSTSVAEIAADCGFATLSSFNRTFRKYQKCTPTECRKLYHSRKRTSPRDS